MASPSYDKAVTSGELSLLVSDYLSSEGFAKTCRQFQEEAAGLLGGTGRPRGLLRLGGGLKPLRAILSEYVDLVEARRRREDYARANPVVAKIFDVIDACAQDSEQSDHARAVTERALVAVATPERNRAGSIYAHGFRTPETSPGKRKNLFGRLDGATATTSGRIGGDPATATPSPLRRKKGTPQRKRTRLAASPGGAASRDERDDRLLPFAEDLAQRINDSSGAVAGIPEDFINKLVTMENLPDDKYDPTFGFEQLLEGLAPPEIDHNVHQAFPHQDDKTLTLPPTSQAESDQLPHHHHHHTAQNGSSGGGAGCAKRKQSLQEYLKSGGQGNVENILQKIHR